jgi:hyaluronan synthase
MSSATLPQGFPAVREPYTGPRTGDQLAALDHLERIALEQAFARMRHAVSPLAQTIPFVQATPMRGTPGAVRIPDVARGDGHSPARYRGDRDQARLAPGQERGGDLAPWRAERKAVPLLAGAAVSVAVLAVWGVRHAWQSAEAAEGIREPFAWAYALVFAILAWQMTACFLERPYRSARGTEELSTAAVVPVYNEDPALFARTLQSLLEQSRRIGAVCVADDGSAVDYSGVREEFELAAMAAGVGVSWVRFPVNRGKRHAHATAFRAAPHSDIYITVDSDAILDYRAVEEGMKPFADPQVQSVAGLLLIANHRKNLLTRATELWYVTSELADRSAQSAFSSVMVNTGTFALYRGEVIRRNLPAYVSETFFGRPVQFSDDSMLTFYAMLAGKTVQQPTAIGFTAMPENLSHHVRQYVRWMRGMTIRTFWRFRYLPLGSYAYWQHAMRWVQACTALPLFIAVAVIEPIERGSWPLGLLLVPVLVGYGRSLRYLTIRRYDEPWWSQALTYALAPLVALWAYTGLRVIWWYGMATCLRTGWGTRQDGVEVTL